MGSWLLVLTLSLFLILIGLYLHWSVVLVGALLPFWTVLSMWRAARRARPRDEGSPN